MTLRQMTNDSVHWFLGELTSRIVAESGIPSDRHHLGKILLQSFKDAPDFVMQIDGATGESETYASALKRTVQCAKCLKNLGLQYGDVVILMAPNHLDVVIPLYAALYLGVIVAVVDRTLTTYELQQSFAISQPKMIFCQNDRASDVQRSLNNLNLDAQIVKFDKGDSFCSFKDFMEQYADDPPVEDFKCTDFDPEDSTAFLIATSGTTGLPKAVAVTHKNFAIFTPYEWSKFTTFPTPTRLAMIGLPLQWLSALVNFIVSPILRFSRLQTSQDMTQNHTYDLINTYRIMSPEAEILNVYGNSELSGFAFQGDNPAPGSCGKPIGCFQYRIIEVETQEDIYEPNVPGELWIKGPSVFKSLCGYTCWGCSNKRRMMCVYGKQFGPIVKIVCNHEYNHEYHNNVEATKEAFAEDRWYKTGDTFYRDENWNFFFVERIKLLLKYKSKKISPVEIEAVIRQHPGVLDVAVTGVRDDECNDLPVACVVPRPGAEPSADEIKDWVKESLTDAKQLRGGVLFIDAIPMTASTKVDRRKLKQMALDMHRE